MGAECFFYVSDENVRKLATAVFSSRGCCRILPRGAVPGVSELFLSYMGKPASGMLGVGGSVALLFLVD